MIAWGSIRSTFSISRGLQSSHLSQLTVGHRALLGPLELNTKTSGFLLPKNAALKQNTPVLNAFWQKAQVSVASFILLSGCPSRIKTP